MHGDKPLSLSFSCEKCVCPVSEFLSLSLSLSSLRRSLRLFHLSFAGYSREERELQKVGGEEGKKEGESAVGGGGGGGGGGGRGGSSSSNSG